MTMVAGIGLEQYGQMDTVLYTSKKREDNKERIASPIPYLLNLSLMDWSLTTYAETVDASTQIISDKQLNAKMYWLESAHSPNDTHKLTVQMVMPLKAQMFTFIPSVAPVTVEPALTSYLRSEGRANEVQADVNVGRSLTVGRCVNRATWLGIDLSRRS